MNQRYPKISVAIALVFVSCTGSLCINRSVCSSHVSITGSRALAKQTQQTPQQIESIAKAIAVKVLSGSDELGTGILIKKQDIIYTVVTNAHVLRAGEPPYRLQTQDGRIYAAKPVPNTKFKQNDLALLQFHSSRHAYAVAVLGSSFRLTRGQDVFAAGYYTSGQKHQQLKGFVFNRGKVSLILDKALEGGYQVGYTNDIAKGMSGGPLLNHRGEVVGIHGKHAYPLWNAPSVFQDGSHASPTLNDAIVRHSWAVPIETLLQLAPPTIHFPFSQRQSRGGGLRSSNSNPAQICCILLQSRRHPL